MMTITAESLTEILRAHLDGRGITLCKSGYLLEGADEDRELNEIVRLVHDADESAPRLRSYAVTMSRTKTQPLSAAELDVLAEQSKVA